MEKIIEVDLHDKFDLVEKYNENKISNELIEYIIKEAIPVNKNEKIKIVINLKCNTDRNCIEILKEGLVEEYFKSIKRHKITEIKQICLLIIGIIFLFLSTLINEQVIWKEILLITGWVPIWEVVDQTLFSDITDNGKRKIIKKILDSEIIVREDKNE